MAVSQGLGLSHQAQSLESPFLSEQLISQGDQAEQGLARSGALVLHTPCLHSSWALAGISLDWA